MGNWPREHLAVLDPSCLRLCHLAVQINTIAALCGFRFQLSGQMRGGGHGCPPWRMRGHGGVG